MKNSAPFGIKQGDGCGPVVLGGLLGGFLFLILAFANFTVLSPAEGADAPCRTTLAIGIVEVLLAAVMATIAWFALFGYGVFRQADSIYRIGLFVAAILLLVPWPCSFPSSAVLVFSSHCRA